MELPNKKYMDELLTRTAPKLIITIICVVMFSGCTAKYIKVDGTKEIIAQEFANNDKVNFYGQYDTEKPCYLIASSKVDCAVFVGYDAAIDKSGNIFISWFNQWDSLFYTPAISPTSQIVHDFKAGGDMVSKSFICADSENNLVVFDLQYISMDAPDWSFGKWKKLRILKWDGKEFSGLQSLMLPESTANPHVGPFYVNHHAKIQFIRPDVKLNKILVIGIYSGGYVSGGYVSGLFTNVTCWKTFLAEWDLKSNNWGICERVARVGEFSSKDMDLAVNKNGNIYAVWNETVDYHYRTSPGRIVFDVFEGGKGQGNRLVSLEESPLDQRYPHLVMDNSDNCHIVWTGADGSGPKQYYYRQYNNQRKWSDIEKIPMGDYSPDMIFIICRTDGYPFIYWHDESSVYFKIRLSDVSWSETYRINLDKSIDAVKVLFDIQRNIHIIMKTKRQDGLEEIYYKKLILR